MKQIILGTLILFWCCAICAAQPEHVLPSEDILTEYEDLFSAEEPLHLTLKFDVNAFKKARREDVFHEAKMTRVVGGDVLESYSVKVKAGGTFKLDYCTMPPISLHIAHAGIAADSPQDLIRMNLVLPCKDAAQFEPYVLREYLAYKIYNIITPLSYQVRLVRLTIIDTGNVNEVTEDWAFLQEPDELMTQRLNAHMISKDKFSLRNVNPELINSLSMFQYMIGNADYSVTGQHNLKVLALKEYGPTGFLTVPYDFDYSGLVNTHYAAPGEALGTNSVRERYYLGPCRSKQVLEETIQELAQFNDEIMEYIKGFEYLDEKERADMTNYLGSYVKESSESGFVDNKITPTCR